MARDQVNYNTRTFGKLQHTITGPSTEAAILSPSVLQADRLSISFTIHIPVKSSNIRNTVVGFLFTIRANGLIGYQVIGYCFPPLSSAQTVESVQSSITSRIVSCQTIPNHCSQLGDNYTGCHPDQHLPRLQW